MKIPTTTDIPQRYTWCLAGICYSSLAILPSFLSYAESYFNPAFLLENGTSVADLSRFERGNHQPAGVYRVDLWRNDEFIGSQDIVFESTTENTGDKSGGLMPCFNQVLLERISLNSSAFPELAQQQNNKCINLLKAVPDATINFDFAAMRLNITIPQIALLSSAHGYIPPEEWDEGIPALLLNYNFTGNRGNGNDSYFFSELSGINIGPWRLRNNDSWNYFRGNGYHSEQWNNIGTWVQRAIIPLKSELVMGDGNTGSDIFDGVGFRGIRLYSSDNMYPDSQQGFAPTVRGIARTAAQLTIRQNGFIIYQSYVSPGAFEITDLHPTSSNGDLDVTIDDRDQHDVNWQLSGGVVGHENGITLSQPLGDTNVLIKAPGAGGVRIENQTGILTDWRGYAVMPYATVYRYNRIALDTNTMGNSIDVEKNISSVVPTQGALVRANFDTRIGVRALITVTQGRKPVPFGSLVRENSTGITSMVGDDGQVYLSGAPLSGELLVQWGDGANSRCIAHYVLPKQSLQQAVTVISAVCTHPGS